MQHPSGGDSEGGSQIACLCLRLSDIRPISPMPNLQKVFLARQSYSAFPQTTERNWGVSGHIGSETPSHSGNSLPQWKLPLTEGTPSHRGNSLPRREFSLTVGMSISPRISGVELPPTMGTLSHSGNVYQPDAYREWNSLPQWELSHTAGNVYQPDAYREWNSLPQWNSLTQWELPSHGGNSLSGKGEKLEF